MREQAVKWQPDDPRHALRAAKQRGEHVHYERAFDPDNRSTWQRERRAQVVLSVCALALVSVFLVAAVKAIAIVCFGGAP